MLPIRVISETDDEPHPGLDSHQAIRSLGWLQYVERDNAASPCATFLASRFTAFDSARLPVDIQPQMDRSVETYCRIVRARSILD